MNYPTPTEEQLLKLEEYDCETWEQYVQYIAEESGCTLELAELIFETLGPEEAFDAFVTECRYALEAE